MNKDYVKVVLEARGSCRKAGGRELRIFLSRVLSDLGSILRTFRLWCFAGQVRVGGVGGEGERENYKLLVVG